MSDSPWGAVTQNLGWVVVGALASVAGIILFSSVGLRGGVEQVLVALSLLPLIVSVVVAQRRTYGRAAQRPVAVAYRERYSLSRRLVPSALLVVGIALAKVLQVLASPPVAQLLAAFAGVIGFVVALTVMRRNL